jgi:hypothetical protein
MREQRMAAVAVPSLLAGSLFLLLFAPDAGGGRNRQPPTPVPRVSIEFVVVDHPGNPDDPVDAICCGAAGDVFAPVHTELGGVDYVYRLSKYEITWDQYAIFLNRVAWHSDPNGLFISYMEGERGGLIRSQNPNGTYKYTPKAGMADKPCGYMDFFRALRFVNWLHNGQPSGQQGPTTTEDGAYTLLGTNPDQPVRNPGVRFWLANEDEWYKAAFYDPDLGVYHDYPLGSDVKPTTDPPPGDQDASNTVFEHMSCPQFDPPPERVWISGLCQPTDVGAYPNAMSPFGVFDLCGNGIELTESFLVHESEIHRVARGTYWNSDSIECRRDYRTSSLQECEGCFGYTFRVAAPY